MISEHLEVGAEFFAEMDERARLSPGEVVMVVPRPGDKVLLSTKPFYPSGIYRLPTGKMLPGETPEEAFRREMAEETGFPPVGTLIETICCLFTCGKDRVEFRSHVFLTPERAEEPAPADLDEELTFRDAPVAELRAVAEELRSLAGRWRDWGRWRAIAHDFALAALEG
ncbi:MAG: NUDIX hydrolase [Armatimonadota bacterium]